MALVLCWYDFVCFGIVGAAFVGSFWVLWRKELAQKHDGNTIYESLITMSADHPPDDHGSFGFLQTNHLPTNHVGSSRLWTTCWKGLHPAILLLTRLLSLLVMAGFLSWDIVEWNATIFVYYTEWTFTLVMIYFALGTVISAYGCWISSNQLPVGSGESVALFKRDEEKGISTSRNLRGREIKGTIELQSYHTEEALRERVGFWGYLLQATYQTCGGAVILTDIVFWCVIVPFLQDERFSLNVLMGGMHSLNVIFLVLDTTLNSLPFPWFRFAYFVQWSCLYIVFQWVIHACGFTWWPYPFLELNTPWAPLWYFALAVVHVPCYGIYALIFKAKNSILPKLFPHAFVRS